MRRTVAILGLVLGIAAAPAVRAGDEMVSPAWPPPPPARPPEPPEGDFGWQVLTADLAGLASSIALGSYSNSMAGLLPYLLAAPAVHLAHEDVGGAAASLFLNVAGPVGLGSLGYWLDRRICRSNEGCGSLGLIVGGLTGFGLAWALDSTYLSHPGPSTKAPKIQVTPAVDPNRMFSLVLSGRF